MTKSSDIRKYLFDVLSDSRDQEQMLSVNVPIPKDVLIRALQQEYFNKTDASNFLGVSLSTFKRWLNSYQIPAVAIDGIVMYRKKDLIAFMDKNAVKG